MTTSTTTPDEAPSADRSVPLLIAAGVLVVMIVAAVLVFGVQRPPTLPSLVDRPEPAPTSSVAWTSWRDGQCVNVAAPDGQVDRPFCRDEGFRLVGWQDDGLVVEQWGAAQARQLTVDPRTGEVLDTSSSTPLDPSSPPEPDPDGAVHHHRSDGALVVEDASGAELWRTESPDGYRLRTTSRSPDGRWVVAIDSADRLLLLDAEGELTPRVWATGVDGYGDLVWEGS